MSDIILSCNNLSKFYGQYPALQNLDFQLKRYYSIIVLSN